jgi:hypothetical protein
LQGGFSLEAFHHHVELEFQVVLFAFGCHVSGPFLVCFFHCLFDQGRDTHAEWMLLFFRAIDKAHKRQEDRPAVTAPQCAIMQV